MVPIVAFKERRSLRALTGLEEIQTHQRAGETQPADHLSSGWEINTNHLTGCDSAWFWLIDL